MITYSLVRCVCVCECVCVFGVFGWEAGLLYSTHCPDTDTSGEEQPDIRWLQSCKNAPEQQQVRLNFLQQPRMWV